MTNLSFHHDPTRLPRPGGASIPVLMYGRRPPCAGAACIGGPVRKSVRRLTRGVPQIAFDFLTVAMAVTAADTFVDRRSSADGWARDLRLLIPVADPAPWQAAVPMLESALRFLSGDQWVLEIVGDGPARPDRQQRGHMVRLDGHDCVCLFSGGLDSTIGTLDLLAAGRRPVLISHSYRGDAERQCLVQAHLPIKVSRFAAIAHPVSLLNGANDVQMRTRSLNFIAYGVLVGAAMAAGSMAQSPIELHVPENGLIALNPPLTPRRIGALSTRTTHPHFLSLVQGVLDTIGIPVRMVTAPYNTMTKGEMMAGCANRQTLEAVAGSTVSCGKWKRTGQQCGRCVPCLIRRAAFHGSGIQDNTDYAGSGHDLVAVMGNEKLRDDLLAMILAARRLPTEDVQRWIACSGPLPASRSDRDALVDVAMRGMTEVSGYLDSLGLLR